VGTLENGGVDLAPFHDLDYLVSAELKAELDQIRSEIFGVKPPEQGGSTANVNPPPDKPQLPVTDKPPLAFYESVEGIGEQSVAFTFPDTLSGWPVAIKAAAFKEIRSNPYGFDQTWSLQPVGLVEIGPGADSGEPRLGAYLVLIDLNSTSLQTPGEVSGEMRQLNGTAVYPLFFSSFPQALNPLRFPGTAVAEFANLPGPMDNGAVITADSVCFVTKVIRESSGEEAYIRFCSTPGSVLSVSANFKSSFEALSDSIRKVAESFGMQDIVQADQVISEMEDPGRIIGCSDKHLSKAQAADLQQACGSDITIAPVNTAILEDQYKNKVVAGLSDQTGRLRFIAAAPGESLQQDDPFEGIFPLAVGVVEVLYTINTDYGAIQPGTYRLDYWFYDNGEFYSATITGTQTDGAPVENQQIPAVPATFINADGSVQPAAQISACRILGRCTFFQKSCQ
jgi:hypothetical protein